MVVQGCVHRIRIRAPCHLYAWIDTRHRRPIHTSEARAFDSRPLFSLSEAARRREWIGGGRAGGFSSVIADLSDLTFETNVERRQKNLQQSGATTGIGVASAGGSSGTDTMRPRIYGACTARGAVCCQVEVPIRLI